MKIRFFTAMLVLGTFLSGITSAFILYNTNPYDGGSTAIFFFYVSAALTLVGLFSSLGILLRKVFIKDSTAVLRNFPHIFRQSMLLSTTCLGALVLATMHVLRWWNVLMLAGLCMLIEIIFFTSRKFRNTDYV